MTNRLLSETSPYLRQHADNPVDWFPWGEEALKLAKHQDKPILLSIGYSSCHWCHVMAGESFEDDEIARIMNLHFINIKVDREERPDLDHIYQTAHAMLTGRHGGWPLTLFLSPDQTPFFGGTYFPKAPAYGLPGFREILPKVAAAYGQSRGEIEKYALELRNALLDTVPVNTSSQTELNDSAIRAALESLAKRFDSTWGGFGVAPKFPNPSLLELCMNQRAHAQLSLFTLEKMAEGGIFDQIGGGFCRYSVDQTWTIPHFEKMLYDNGGLIKLYAEAWVKTKNPLFLETVRGIAGWTIREMQAPEGGYYSSLDADSEHVEGKFYRWKHNEIAALLDADEFEVASLYFGLDLPPNFEAHHHLKIERHLDDITPETWKSVETCRLLIDSAKMKLFAAREKRIRPGRDEKILVSWNALMIGGMAKAGRIFGESTWLASAKNASRFIRERMWKAGKLLAAYKDGQARFNAYLDDYAFLLAAQLELMQAWFDIETLDFATQLADALLAHFEDGENGGFYFTSHDHESLLVRQKPAEDGAMPSGNGIAAFALQRLGHLLGEKRYLDASERTLRLFYPSISDHPTAFASLLTALEEKFNPSSIVILSGTMEEFRPWQDALSQRPLPHAMVLAIAHDTPGLPPALDKGNENRFAAWLCKGTLCLPPVFDLDELLHHLDTPS